MATRLRKTRKYRGSRNHGWGQIGQHRASGHKGGLGQSGLLKHHFSSMLKDDPDHFGHNSNNPPQRNIIKNGQVLGILTICISSMEKKKMVKKP